MAVYVPLYELPGDEGVQMSVRPLEMFVGDVEVGSELRPRFRFNGGGTDEVGSAGSWPSVRGRVAAAK